MGTGLTPRGETDVGDVAEELARRELPRGALLGTVLFTLLVGLLHEPILERLMYAVPTLAALR